MTKIKSLSFAILLALAAVGCQSATQSEPENASRTANSPPPSKTPPAPAKAPPQIPLEITGFANKSVAALDEAFGTPLESSALENGGEYRLYRIDGQSKGLAVRFYGQQAKSFNLILDEPVQSSKEALQRVFDIDVGNSAPVRDAREPLTESYRGTFGGVKFKKISAKRQESGRGFIFVLAEVAE